MLLLNRKVKVERIAVDNNILVKLVGIDKTVKNLINDGYEFNEISSRMVLSQNKINSTKDKSVFELYKKIYNQKIRIVILPTILREVFSKENFERYVFKKSNLNVFLHDHNIEHACFTDTQNHFIEELTNAFVSPLNPVFILNKNTDHKTNDAKIIAEACFAQVDVLTLDKHFKNSLGIKSVIKNFYKENVEKNEHIFEKFKISQPIDPIDYINESKDFEL